MGLTNSEFVTKVFDHMKNTQCEVNLCHEMSDHRPEEVARCNLQKRWVFDPPMPGYDWYEATVNHAEAIQMLSVFPGDHPVPAEITEEWLDGELAGIEPKTCPLSNGEFMAKAYNHYVSASCKENKCPEMSDHRPEELGRCNLQVMGIYGEPMPGYDWYEASTSYQEVDRVAKMLFVASMPFVLDGPANGEPLTSEWLDTQLNKIDVETPCQCPVITRAELAKSLIIKIDGLADYEAPATPTFDDVPADAWYYDYVEAAVQLGIVSGYTDAAGNLTGLFGPGDTVNRAAMVKVVITAVDGLLNYMAPTTPT
ncbi:unnamed protein product, partial [marine sediment metagenome]